MNRRGFLLGMLAAGAAPAIVRAESLMRLPVRRRLVFSEGIAFYEGYQFIEGQVAFNDISALIAETFRANKPQLLANITAHNALLNRLSLGKELSLVIAPPARTEFELVSIPEAETKYPGYRGDDTPHFAWKVWKFDKN